MMVPKEYVRWRLTGEYATEVSDASGMQLLDIRSRKWCDELLTALGIDKSLLCDVFESPEVTGYITKEASERTGLAVGTPVAGGGGDNAAAGVGMGAMYPGRAITTIGTSGVPYLCSDKVLPDKQGRVNCLCAAAPGMWMMMGCIQSAGLSLRWLRDTCCSDEKREAEARGMDPFEVIDEYAAKIPIGSDGLVFLPYLMGERSPHSDADARGVFFGLSAIHTRAHMMRSVMEGVTFSMAECVDAYRELGLSITDMRVCGGGGRSPFWRQMLADVYGCEVSTVQMEDGGAALGAAILAGTGAGEFKTVQEGCDAIIKKKLTHSPDMEAHEKYMGYYKLHNELYWTLFDSYKKLSLLTR